MSQPTIVWDTTLSKDWPYKTDDGRMLEHQHRMDRRPLSSLRLHEKPSSHRVAKMIALMRSGVKISMPLIGEDGMVLDGHCRITAAKRIEGEDAIIPTQVCQIVNIAPSSDPAPDDNTRKVLPQDIDNHLLDACGRIEAGFFFEEGGCFGMALALHETFTKAGIDTSFAVQTLFVHGMVKVVDDLYDYQGKHFGNTPADLKVLGHEEFLEFAKHHGHEEEDLESAKAFALTAINLAIEMGRDAEVTGHTASSPGM